MPAQASVLDKVYSQFPALKHKNFRLYFAGQLISFTGTWLHGVAQGWLVYEQTNSAFWLGIVSALSTLPVLFFSLYGGFLVDRFSRKNLLYVTQISSLVLAFVLGVLALNNLATLPVLLIISLLTGIITTLDNPATQSLVVEIVNKEDRASAIGLHTTIFNLGGVLGPAVAGFLIAMVGLGNIFLINALSFLAFLASLYFIKMEVETKRRDKKPIQAIKEGISYSISHPVISVLLLTAGAGAIFCFSHATIMPIMAEQVFSNGSKGLGYLLSASGLGALVASVIVSSKFKNRLPNLIILGNIIFLSSAFVFSFMNNLYMALPFLFFSGLGLTFQFYTIYATIQKLVKEEYRGRVSSIYFLMFVGLSPLGSLFLGSASSFFGPQFAIRLCVFIMALYTIYMYLNRGKVKSRYYAYQQNIQPNYAYVQSD